MSNKLNNFNIYKEFCKHLFKKKNKFINLFKIFFNFFPNDANLKKKKLIDF